MTTKITSAELESCTADAPALSDDSAAIVTSDWVKQLLAQYSPSGGSATLPGGLTFKWGTTSTFDTGPLTVTFPTPFPSNCFQVVMTDTLSGGASRIWSVLSISRFSFSCHNNGTGSGLWLAIGN